MSIKLSDVCDVRDGTHDSPSYVDIGFPLVTSKNIINGKIDLSVVNYISKEDYDKINQRSKVDIGDIIMPMIGTIGNPCLIENGCDFAIKNVALIKFPNKTVINKFVWYYLKSQAFIRYVEEKNRGGTQKFISLGDIRNITIPEFSTEKQLEIIKKLDTLKSIIIHRRTQLEKLDELIKARFVEMFGNFDLANTKSDWISISKIGRIVGGSTPKTNIPEFWDGEYRWISPAELKQDSGIIYDSVKKITKAGIDSCSLQELPIGTVILSSRAPIGKVAIAGSTFYCNQGFKNIICNDKVLPRYLYTLLLFNTDYLNSLGRGATFKEISKSIVENIKIPVPPLKLQNQFADFVKQIDKSKFIEKEVSQ